MSGKKMESPFQIIKKDETKLSEILNYFNNEYEDARKELKISGKLESYISQISANFEYRYSQLQELEAILEYFNIKLKSIKSKKYQQLINTSARALTQSDLRQYIDGDEQVVAVQTIINEIALVRNKYISLSKGFESQNFSLNNLTKLYVAGLDEIRIN